MLEPPPPVDLATLGHTIAIARQTAGLTIEGLAERSGVSRRMLVEVEQGRVNCTIGVLHSIAHAVAVPVSQLADAVCTDGASAELP